MPFANSNAAKLHYTIRGDGPETVVLIMGLGGHASEWGEPFLGRLEPRLRVICMDNRGVGESTAAGDTWSLADMAADVCAVLDAAGVARAHVLGTSMGGMIAQIVATAHAERVERLILMSTTFGGPTATPPTPEAAAMLVPVPSVTIHEMQRRTLVALTAPGFAAAHPELVEELAALRQRVPTRGRVYRAQVAAIVESDRSELVRGIRAPTLVLHGSDDPLIPLDNGKRLAERIPAQRFIVLPHCGHFPYTELPGQTAAAVLGFLA